VGEDPSGGAYDEPIFDKYNRPHNPMVNAGAIMVSTLLVNEGKTIVDLIEFFRKACGFEPRINMRLFKEESLRNYSNHSLRSFMLARRCYP